MTAEFVDFALELTRAARGETLPRWRDCAPAENKGTTVFDPVTDADREAERAMRAIIHERFPDHGVGGEEFGETGGTSNFTWSLDPVDGTRSFICGLPNWTTLIALLDSAAPALGVIDAPALDETYIGHGGEAWMLDRGKKSQLRTSGCTTVADARLSTTDPFLFKNARAFDSARNRAKVTRYGHDGYAYARLAAGTIDLVIESDLKAHDYNALIPVVRAAGGHIGDWHGGEDFAVGQVVAASTPELYREAVALLSE